MLTFCFAVTVCVSSPEFDPGPLTILRHRYQVINTTSTANTTGRILWDKKKYITGTLLPIIRLRPPQSNQSNRGKVSLLFRRDEGRWTSLGSMWREKKPGGRERLGRVHYENTIRTKFRGSTFGANARQKDVMYTRQTLICMSLALQPFLLLQPPE